MNDIAESHSFRESETIFGFRLDLGEWVSDRQTDRDQLFPAIGGKSEVTDPICEVERAANQLAFAGDVFRPRDAPRAKVHVGARLVARQPTLLDQVEAELTESIAVLVVVEFAARPTSRTRRMPKHDGIAVAVLEAESHQAADDQRIERCSSKRSDGVTISVKTSSVSRTSGSVIERQIHELFDRRLPSSVQIRSYSRITSSRVGWFDHTVPSLAEPVQKYVHRAITLIRGGVQGESQARCYAEVVTIVCALRQQRESILCGDHLRGQQLALGHQILDREDELVVTRPGLVRQQALGRL